MARSSDRAPQIAPIALEPAARVVDTYVRPAQPSASPLHALARSLSSLDSDLAAWARKQDADQKEQDELRATRDHIMENQPGYVAATNGENPDAGPSIFGVTLPKGVFPVTQSPYYMRHREKLAGDTAGDRLGFYLDQEYQKLDKVNLSYEDMDKWFTEKVKSYAGNLPLGHMRGFGPHVARYRNAYLQRWTVDRNQAVQEDTLNRQGATFKNTITAHLNEGLKNPQGWDRKKLVEDLQQKRQEAFAAGMEKKKVNEMLMDTLALQAIDRQDPLLLDVMDDLRDEQGVKLGDTPYGSKKRFETKETLIRIADRQLAEQQRLDKEHDKKAHQAALAEVTRMLEANPRADIPEELIARIEKVDGNFRKDLVGMRNAFANFQSKDDPAEVLRVQEEIMSGKGEQAVWSAFRSGRLKSPETFRALLGDVERFQKASQGDSPVFQNSAWKTLEREIIRKTGIKDSSFNVLGEPGMSPAGRQAAVAAKREMLDWLAKNPQATEIEKLNKIFEIQEAVLKGLEGDAGEDQKFNPPSTFQQQDNRPKQTPPAAGPREVIAPPAPTIDQLPPDQRTAFENLANQSGRNVNDLVREAHERLWKLRQQGPGPGAVDPENPTGRVKTIPLGPQGPIQQPQQQQQQPVPEQRGDIQPPVAPQGVNIQGSTVEIPGLGKFDLAATEPQAIQSMAGAISKRLRGAFEGLKAGTFGSQNSALSGKEIVQAADALEAISKLNPETIQAVLAPPQGTSAEGDLNAPPAPQQPDITSETPVSRRTPFNKAGRQAVVQAKVDAQTAYSAIPRIDGKGEDQLAKFMEWNNDPHGNHERIMQEIHPDLARVIARAQEIDPEVRFIVGSGKRTPEQQQKAKAWGWSQTDKLGDHGTGNAADLWIVDKDGKVRFDDDAGYEKLGRAMKQAAAELGVTLDAGADWKGFKDKPHFGIKNPRANAEPYQPRQPDITTEATPADDKPVRAPEGETGVGDGPGGGLPQETTASEAAATLKTVPLENQPKGFMGQVKPKAKTTGATKDQTRRTKMNLPAGSLDEVVAKGEGSYNSYNRGVAGDSARSGKRYNFTDMTVREIMQMQSSRGPDRIFAVGKFQIIPETMRVVVNSMGLTGDEKFTPELQHRMFREVLVASKRPAIKAYITGDDDSPAALWKAQLALAQEFASVGVPAGAKDHRGRAVPEGSTYYGGIGGNAASTPPAAVARAMAFERQRYRELLQQGLSPAQAWASLSAGNTKLASK